MDLNRETEKPEAAPAGEQKARPFVSAPDFSLPVKPISEIVADPEFPKSSLGQHVEIGGNAGVVVEIVKSSIKVRSAEGITMSYNFNALRRLYGPKAEPAQAEPAPEPAPEQVKTEPKRNIVLNPDFDSPLHPIEEMVINTDFPHCALGRLIDLHGYSGVVIEIVGRSLKVRSREGSTRSYNAEGLKKLYATKRVPALAPLGN